MSSGSGAGREPKNYKMTDVWENMICIWKPEVVKKCITLYLHLWNVNINLQSYCEFYLLLEVQICFYLITEPLMQFIEHIRAIIQCWIIPVFIEKKWGGAISDITGMV